MIGALTASVLSYVVVGVILLRDSTLLGALVMVGVPVFSGLLFMLVKPWRERQSGSRTAAQVMNDVAGDAIGRRGLSRGTVSLLRRSVLHGSTDFPVD